MVERIISGGQTGADRGGLDAAIELKVVHGGWCPKGRLAEDGTVPVRYALRETASSEYAERTRRNVEEADATVLFTRGAPTGGSALTAEIAATLGRPLLHLDLERLDRVSAAEGLRRFVEARRSRTLNLAGSRESLAPGIADDVRRILIAALGSGADQVRV